MLSVAVLVVAVAIAVPVPGWGQGFDQACLAFAFARSFRNGLRKVYPIKSSQDFSVLPDFLGVALRGTKKIQ